MGHLMRTSDNLNPRGYYEDYVSHGLARIMSENNISGLHYLKIMNTWHKDCEMWGAKDPWFVYAKPQVLNAITPDLAIFCFRALDPTIESWKKVFVKNNPNKPITPRVIDQYKELTVSREKACKHMMGIWTKNVAFDFSVRVDEKHIEDTIRKGLRL
jgi:hypothetical protein